MHTRRALLAGAGSLLLAGCNTLTGEDPSDGEGADSTPVGARADSDSLTLQSQAFDEGGSIPATYTADGTNESPPLRIGGVPKGVESLALVVDDPDAPGGRFVHWLIWNIPPETTEIRRGLPRTERIEGIGGARQGRNGFGNIGYSGPAPPQGDDPHTYVFTLTALETTLGVESGVDREALDSAMAGKVVVSTQLRGTYGR